MNNDINSSSVTGGYVNQTSQAMNNNSYDDPFAHYAERKRKERENNAGNSPGFIDTFVLHGQVQAYEAELQFLSSNKSDAGGTSVGISDSKLRFLVIKSAGIVQISLVSLFLNFFLFVILFLKFNQLVAFITSAILLIHTFFPAFIIYGMKRFVVGKKFTQKFYKKMLSTWRLFEVLYISLFILVVYLIELDWKTYLLELSKYASEIKIIGNLLKKMILSIDATKFNLMFEVYGLIMLFGLGAYLVAVFYRHKKASMEQIDIKFEHDKESLRPLQIARLKAGKLKKRRD